jgi:hypothetical protein
MHVEAEPKMTAPIHGEILNALRHLARHGALAPSLWSVTFFALAFAPLRRGSFLDVLDSAIRYLQVAQFNPELNFHPLVEPDQVLAWSAIPMEQRRAAAQAVGLEVWDYEPCSPHERNLVSWSLEALTGVRVRFSHEDCPPLQDGSLPS